MQAKWDELTIPHLDSVQEIIEGSLKAQQKILTGYKGNPKTNWKKFVEAREPKHVAISLTGEPTLYEPLGDLIEGFFNRGLTTFLVSNGTLPNRLLKLSKEPSQLYVSLCAPNEQVYNQLCRPLVPLAWEKLNETLESLQSFRCPTVTRMTLVRGRNMDRIDEYARLIAKANPTYIEAKAYMHIGFSSLRLGFDSMPTHGEVREFASVLAEKTGYRIIDDSPDSRVVLLSQLEKAKKVEP
jgi:tRNA wybutosine-synthesizing protein 1